MTKKQPASEPTKGKRRDPKFYVLLGILALTVFAAWYQWSGTTPRYQPPAPPAKRLIPHTKADALKDPLATQDVPLVYADLLKERAPFTAEKRNIFSFHVPPPPPPPPRKQLADGSIAGDTPPPPPPPPVCGDKKCEGAETYENCPSDCQPVLQPINLKYIGYAKELDESVAFLTDGKEVYMGKVNDIIANKYRVNSITGDNVELSYLNLPPNYSKKIPFEGNNKNQ